MKIITGYKSINDVKSPAGRSFEPPIQNEKRSSIPIAVIDDQTFEAGRNLRNYGYDIAEIGDINNVSSVEKYPVILCDLMDVGLSFDKSLQGAALIKEIRRNYPAIVVAAYTGSSTMSDATHRAKLLADKYIQKDAELETWTEELDNLINLASDPSEIWERIRLSLVEERISTKQIMELEDAYVRSINAKDKDFDAIHTIIGKGAIKGVAADIAKGVASSAIFSVLMA